MRLMNARTFRPTGAAVRGDEYLRDVTRDVNRLLQSVQRDFRYDALRLNHEDLLWLGAILAEFAEDLRHGIGIWCAYEECNRRWFKTPLPMTGTSTDAEPNAISADRVTHLLWVLYTELHPDLTLGPTHKDLSHMAAVVAEFLTSRMASAPRTSGIKAFLDTPNEYGWDIKRKLVWLGTSSYFFRTACRNYGADQEPDGDEEGIAWTDDFVCQECTQWSGLGVPDVLADMLPLSEEQRAVLRSWHERHAACYRVDSVEGTLLKATNLVNGEPYAVMMGDGPQPFATGAVIFGSLVPWGKCWYWSGMQRTYTMADSSGFPEIRRSFVAKSPRIAYRYCQDLLAKAVAANERHYRNFLSYHLGKDLVVYPDGLSMAADEQQRYRLMYEAEPRPTVERVMAERGLKNPWPEMKYPDRILKSGDGIGLYYDRQEGVEMMLGFNDVLSGLAKKGCDLTDSESEAIKEFVRSRSISPAFVRRMVQEYGEISIRAAFLLRDCGAEYAVEYLLRRHKGAAFRKIYPNVSLV